MSNLEEINKLQNIVKYSQALYSDGVLYFSGEVILATAERGNLMRSDLKSIKQCIESIEKVLSADND